MKKIVLFFTVIALLSVSSLTANNQDGLQKKDTIHAGHHQQEKSEVKGSHTILKVEGKCDMCKKRIETAALNVEGVSSAIWDKKTKDLHLNIDEKKTSIEAISKAVAKVGHDTEKDQTDKKTYNALPGCCKYR
ncbi:MAG: hypothetical protein BGO29_15250 [Bacteroidales bacterium 36-12]|nr:MAG: hypothetical protein BGO29_15250 [Bacteroidales bacterium 36-12]